MGEVRGHSGQRATQDSALAVAVVVEVARVDHPGRGCCPVDVEGAVGQEAGGVVHQPTEVELVEQALLGAVDELREVGEVLKRGDRVWDV